MRRILKLRFSLLATLFVAAALSARGQPAPPEVIEDHWYVIELDGAHAGYAHELVTDEGGHYRTTSEQHLSYRRGTRDIVEVSVNLMYVETHSGEPVEIEVNWNLSGAPVIREWTFTGDTVREVIRQGGREATRTFAKPAGEWLMPHAASRFEAERRRAGADEMTYRSVDVSSGFRIVDVIEKRTGSETVVLDERPVTVSVWEVSIRANGETINTSSAKVSEDDVIVFATETFGALTLMRRLATREEAQMRLTEPPELLARTFVRPSRPIERADRTRWAEYVIHSRHGEKISLPTAASQRAEPDEASGAVRVTVNIDHPQPAGEIENREGLLASNHLIDANDARIIALRDRTLAHAPDDPARRAELLRVATNRHITSKGLGAAFATASETVRDRAGDCSEHALLLCALLRADGIPARIATGMIYADEFAGQRGIFAWHMWTQALIDERWIDLDATMPRPFSAGHILTSTSDLADGALSDEFTRAARLLGTIDIEVIDYGHARK